MVCITTYLAETLGTLTPGAVHVHICMAIHVDQSAAHYAVDG